MFDGLQDKLQGVFTRLKGEGKVTKEVLDAALREIRLALLEADVNIRRGQEASSGVHQGKGPRARTVLGSLTPAQQVDEDRQRGIDGAARAAQAAGMNLDVENAPDQGHRPTVVMVMWPAGLGQDDLLAASSPRG